MTTPFPSPTDPAARQFFATGAVAHWEPVGRWLRIGERHCWVAPGVAVAGLIEGRRITASGYQDDLTARWVVTQLTLG